MAGAIVSGQLHGPAKADPAPVNFWAKPAPV
jgi:hypothetical protein